MKMLITGQNGIFGQKKLYTFPSSEIRNFEIIDFLRDKNKNRKF